MTKEEFKEKQLRVALDLQCIAMLLPDDVFEKCKEYLHRLDSNCSDIIHELDTYIEE